VFDLLDPNSPVVSRADGASLAKPAVPARVPIQIRETMNGGIQLAGVTKVEVRTKEEMTTHLSRGSRSRAIRSTNMNSHSRFTFRNPLVFSHIPCNHVIGSYIAYNVVLYVFCPVAHMLFLQLPWSKRKCLIACLE
jgi:hypothetical protein